MSWPNKLQASAFSHFVEVPVTRRAAVTRVGVVTGRSCAYRLLRDEDVLTVETDGAQVAIKSPAGMFRSGFGRCVGDVLYLDGVPAACPDDIVYRVEPA